MKYQIPVKTFEESRERDIEPIIPFDETEFKNRLPWMKQFLFEAKTTDFEGSPPVGWQD